MKINIKNYKQIVVLTGAGISAASGIRTYRGENGVWQEFDVGQHGRVDRLKDNPQQIWTLFGALRAQLKSAMPNQAHLALAALEQNLRPDQQFTLITQNVDGLHQRAGSVNVVELHGNIRYTKCANAACDLAPFTDENTYADAVPRCSKCGDVLRPDIVLFGEMIPALPGWQAKRALRECDLFMAIGTSGSVAPASNFVRSAEYAGARTIYINLDPMEPRNPAFKEEYLGKAEELLPAML